MDVSSLRVGSKVRYRILCSFRCEKQQSSSILMFVVLKRSQVMVRHRSSQAGAFGEAQPPANITLSRKPGTKSRCAVQAMSNALE